MSTSQEQRAKVLSPLDCREDHNHEQQLVNISTTYLFQRLKAVCLERGSYR
jgi:hypothetical protein